jgi:hypothetical protein
LYIHKPLTPLPPPHYLSQTTNTTTTTTLPAADSDTISPAIDIPSDPLIVEATDPSGAKVAYEVMQKIMLISK